MLVVVVVEVVGVVIIVYTTSQDCLSLNNKKIKIKKHNK